LDPRGMQTTFRAPLYPALVAVSYWLVGAGESRFLAVRLGQAFLGAALAPMTYLAARQVLAPLGRNTRRLERAARVASISVVAYPSLIVFPLALATENLFFPLVLGASMALLAIPRALGEAEGPPAGRWRPWVLAVSAGTLLGLIALTRSVAVPMVAAAMLWLWFVLHQPRLAALSGLAFAVTVTPWVMRNSLVTGKLTGIETSMGYNLYVGYHPEATGSFQFGPSLDLLPILDDRMRDEVGIQRAIEFMKSDPGRVPYLAVRRLGHFFNLEWRPFVYFYSNGALGWLPPPVVALMLVLLALPFIFVSIGALLGFASLARTPQLALLALLFLAYLLPHVVILSGSRFHLAVLPFLAILCGHALAGGARWRWWVAIGLALLTMNWASQLAGAWPTLVQLLGPGGNHLYLPY
jgi:hypothetical protein